MTDPKRLLTEGSDFERAMIETWNDERPSDAARQRALAIVGVGAGFAAGTASIASQMQTGAAIAPKALAGGGAWGAKWILVSALALATTGGTIAVIRHRSHAPSLPAIAVSTPPPSSEAISVSTPIQPRLEPAPAPIETAHEAPRRANAPHDSKSVSNAKSPSDLSAQIAMLDRARSALVGNDAASALRFLDEYGATYPQGALAEEAELLRIEALVASGRRAAAEARATHFAAAYPASTHLRRIHELLNDSPSRP